jgi:hypothetical protein
MGRVRQRAIAVVLAVVGTLAFAGAAQAAQVTISGFTVNGVSTTKAVVGDTVVVSGTNFLTGGSASSNVVKVNGVGIATFSVNAGGTTITFTVPAAATPGKITVTSGANGSATSGNDLYVLPAGYTASQVDAAARLTLGSPTSVGVTQPGHVAELLFDNPTANGRVFVRWANSTIGSFSLTLRDPSGTFLVAASAGNGSNYIDATKLVATGTHAIVIAPDVPFTGSLQLTVYAVPNDLTGAFALSASGSAQALAIAAPGQNASLSFSNTTVGRRVFLSLTSSTITNGLMALVDPNGAVVATAPISRTDSYIDTATLALTGTYQVLIDPAGTATGNATATLYDDGTSDPAPVQLASLPGSGTVATPTPGLNGSLRFPGTAGHSIAVAITGSTYSSVIVQIMKPDGTPLASSIDLHAATTFIDATPIPVGAGGQLTVRVDPHGALTGQLTIAVYDIASDATSSLSLSTTPPAQAQATVTTTTPGQNGSLGFSAAAGERVFVQITTATYTAGMVSLRNGSGATIASASFGKTGGFIDTTTLPTAGAYSVFLDPQVGATGSATVIVYAVPADIGPLAVTPAGTLAGGQASATISTPGQNATFRFTLASSARLAIKVGGTFIKAGTLFVLDGGGNAVGSSLAFGTSGAFRDPATLPAGTYTLLADPRGAERGNVVISLYLVPNDVTDTVVPGGPADTLVNTVPGQNMWTTFTGTNGHAVSVTASGSTISQGTVSLVGSAGNVVATASLTTSGAYIDTKTLPATDTYKVLVDPRAAAVGTVAIRVVDVPADTTGAIALNGVPVLAGNLVAGQNARLTFAASATQRISIAAGAGTTSGTLRLLNPDGTTLTTKPFSATGAFIDAVTVGQTGTYTLVVDFAASQVGQVAATAWAVPANVNGGALVSGGAALRVTTSIPGQNASVTFSGSAQDIVVLSLTSVTEGTSSCCGVKVTITAPGGSAVILPKLVGTNGAAITIQLPADGTYTVGLDPQGAVVGGATLRLTPAL